MYKRVFIVAEGNWGQVKPAEYVDQVEMYRRILAEANDFQGHKAANVEVVETIAEAERRIPTEADKVVFISRGVAEAAKRIAKANPRVRVVVFTGLVPEGEVVWANKGHTADMKTIADIVLHW